MTRKISPQIHAYANSEALTQDAAKFLIDEANKAVGQNGRFVIALSGGSTPKRLYEVLASEKWRTKTDWSRWTFFFSDERLVPRDDEQSNFALANHGLFSHLPVTNSNIHSIPEGSDKDAIATAYEHTVRSIVGETNNLPSFDVIVLGLGSDGHTASLFPDKPAVRETERLVVASEPGVLPPPVNRITFTFPLINAAKAIAFLAAGSDKAEAFAAVKNGNTSKAPAALVNPTSGSVHWFIGKELLGL